MLSDRGKKRSDHIIGKINEIAFGYRETHVGLQESIIIKLQLNLNQRFNKIIKSNDLTPSVVDQASPGIGGPDGSVVGQDNLGKQLIPKVLCRFHPVPDEGSRA